MKEYLTLQSGSLGVGSRHMDVGKGASHGGADYGRRGTWAMQAQTPHVRPGSPAPDDAPYVVYYCETYMNLYGRHWPHRPGAARMPLVTVEKVTSKMNDKYCVSM